MVFPLHPRTRARLEAAGLLRPARTGPTGLVPPLGYLDFLKLARHARAVLTDSGGVQKEAYLLGVPCVTLRDTPSGSRRSRRAGTCSWTWTREAALAALERTAARGRAARAVRRRPRRRARLRRALRLHSRAMKIGIVGLGYVGLPLAVAFCEAGHEVVGVDTDPRERRRARPRAAHIEDVSAEALAAVAERFHATTRYAELAKVDAVIDRRAHAAHAQPRARPRAADRVGHGARGRAAGGPARGARVHDLPGHHARAASCRCSRSPGSPPGATSTSRSRPSASTRAAPTTRCAPPRRSSAASPTSACERAVDLYSRSATRSCRSRPGGRRAHQAARERLPLGEHRARQRAGDALRPDGDRHLGGRRRRRDQAVRLHVASSPGPGMGGHCLPVDPFYLAWRAREYDMPTEFIELAGEVNQRMPYFCVEGIARALNDHSKPVRGSRIGDPRRLVQAGRGRPARVAGAQDHAACCASTAPSSSTTTTTCPSCPSSTWPEPLASCARRTRTAP